MKERYLLVLVRGIG